MAILGRPLCCTTFRKRYFSIHFDENDAASFLLSPIEISVLVGGGLDDPLIPYPVILIAGADKTGPPPAPSALS